MVGWLSAAASFWIPPLVAPVPSPDATGTRLPLLPSLVPDTSSPLVSPEHDGFEDAVRSGSVRRPLLMGPGWGLGALGRAGGRPASTHQGGANLPHVTRGVSGFSPQRDRLPLSWSVPASECRGPFRPQGRGLRAGSPPLGGRASAYGIWGSSVRNTSLFSALSFFLQPLMYTGMESGDFLPTLGYDP